VAPASPADGGRGPAPRERQARRVRSVSATELVGVRGGLLRDAFARLVPRFEKENAPAKVITNARRHAGAAHTPDRARAPPPTSRVVKLHIDALAAQGLVIAPAIFACNEPVVVVRAARPPPSRPSPTCRVRSGIGRRRTEVPSALTRIEILKKAAASWAPTS